MRRHLIERHAKAAAAGIDDGRGVALYLFKDNEMIEIPMEHGGRLDIADALQTNADGAWSEAEAGGEVHESAQIDTARSDCDFGAKGSEIGLETPGGRDHGETS